MHYEEIIREKDTQIRLLEETLAADVKQEQGGTREFELESIKEHY